MGAARPPTGWSHRVKSAIPSIRRVLPGSNTALMVPHEVIPSGKGAAQLAVTGTHDGGRRPVELAAGARVTGELLCSKNIRTLWAVYAEGLVAHASMRRGSEWNTECEAGKGLELNRGARSVADENRKRGNASGGT